MELTKTRYKQTEVGLIPNDWKLDTINNIMKSIVRGPFGGALKKDFFVKDGYKVYEQRNAIYQDIHLGNYYINRKKFDELKRFSINKGDFIVSCSGTIGKIYRIPEKFEVGVINQALLKLTIDEDKVKPLFFYYQFIEDNFQNRVIEDQGGAMKNLVGMPIFKLSLFILPELNEQKAIAQVLSDTDALIQALEKKIAKKKLIKKGVIQRLLAPKEDWEVKTIKELANYRRGSFPQPYGLPQWYDDISGMPFIQVVDVGDNFKLKKETKQRISKLGAEKSVFVKKGTIILTIQGSIGRICITDYDAYVDRTLLIFESFKEKFNSYFFMLSIWRKFQIEKQNAPGGIIKTITKEALSSFEIAYPKLEEQIQIAEILSDMDKETKNLEQKLLKYQLAKQGLMQQLLTGKIRLV